MQRNKEAIKSLNEWLAQLASTGRAAALARFALAP
jgi:hypothetical protein